MVRCDSKMARPQPPQTIRLRPSDFGGQVCCRAIPLIIPNPPSADKKKDLHRL